jgi:adenylate cyclase class 2
MSAKHNIETEVKFCLQTPEELRKAILAAGAESIGKVFEINIRLDDKNNSLSKKKSLLRLRRDMKTTLTFKSLPETRDNSFKIFNEIEVEVNDFYKAKSILESLGFFEVQRYEKWRETFLFGKAKLLIDNLPYGDFLEIEGEKEDIISIASLIDMNWERRIILNYLEIFAIIKEKLGLPFNDVTFENFKKNNVLISGKDLLKQFGLDFIAQMPVSSL